MLQREGSGTVGRPRDPEVERGILEATQDLLIENGYPGTTIAAVAARARCGKSAIYRRWDSKPELVVAAVKAVQQPTELPDTGDLRSDLLAAAMHFADSGDRSAAVLARVLSEIGRDRELQKVAHRVIGGPPVAALIAVIERWIARGIVAPDVHVDVVAGIVPTAAFGAVTLTQRSLEPKAITELIDVVVLPALLCTDRAVAG
ncbi:TetR/AcrR family transcriptional regulator [Microbacterium schleiferi]|uniref:TetR/AcrR family transcriptional regulator n=1 Tax=Microbacterium schleiferi TaxID=69362 RepID=A0A7S8RGI7_9MICO|nr:TetR/AcrR family transcriptional regulator [Microbacterium schleiferi]QPE03422.1 TetR/AcrR family transcriptional regulator [Microbacterium schleiferi]